MRSPAWMVSYRHDILRGTLAEKRKGGAAIGGTELLERFNGREGVHAFARTCRAGVAPVVGREGDS